MTKTCAVCGQTHKSEIIKQVALECGWPVLSLELVDTEIAEIADLGLPYLDEGSEDE